MIQKLDWNDELMELEARNNLTNGQTVESGVSREGWDLRWEVERLKKALAERDQEIGMLRFEKMMLKSKLNAMGR